MGIKVIGIDIVILSFELIMVCALFGLNLSISKKKNKMIKKMDKEQEDKREQMLQEILMNNKRG